MNQDYVNKTVVLLLALGISALFLTMIQPFLMALFLAGLFSALARPLFLRLQTRFSGRRHLASMTTLLIMAVVVLIPLGVLFWVLLAQALDVSHAIGEWFKGSLQDPGVLADHLHRLPFYDQLMVYEDEILGQLGNATTALSKLLVEWVSGVTLGTANFVFMTFVLLYSMYFLQMDGPRLIERILYYLPLKTSDERVMLEKFTSVTRATLKGSLLIGLLQGTLAGIAFAVAGIDNAVFWGTVMAVLSVIPNVGAALVWAPAVAILVVQGEVVTGVTLGLFCGLVVGSLDNLLRPVLVGKDTKMHELMIFFGTLGGIFMFGLAGIFIGPVVASLFISVWEMYGVEFAEVLPDVEEVLEGIDLIEEPPTAPESAASEAGGDQDAAGGR
ncbi:AI-2E family transporter [Marichromatium gracile]|uniref:AI-2E family transporter n=1 Tax=Marichromatium gracile TaxID=1048 RepID=UPI001F34F05A|nr:AI-2E family transporter [Marichromatium gracile]MCF1183633.1 AI-2E family transporter [Marichromatium gracile]